jgi:biopolymer transport protein ExbB/TolQ
MTSGLSREFVYQVFALLVAVIVVHAAYVSVIRPQAQAVEQQQQAILAENPDHTPERSLWIVIRDYEQEVCFILLFWAMALLAYKAQAVRRERALLRADLLPVAAGESILPEDTRAYARVIEALPEEQRDALYPRALSTALHRFRATRNVQDVSEAVSALCAAETDRLDSERSMIRYIAWAIPSIGFIGTVRGIGDALGLAHQAVGGDISGVTASLGLAFNSTLVALVLAIILMFLLHQLEWVQERLVQDTQTACDRNLVQNLQAH